MSAQWEQLGEVQAARIQVSSSSESLSSDVLSPRTDDAASGSPNPDSKSVDVHATSSSSVEAAAPAKTGLWGHGGLQQQVPKWKILAMIGCVLVGYGIAMLVNGVAGSLLTPRFFAPTTSDADPLAGLGLVTRVADPLFLMSVFRVFATLCLLPVMYFSGDIPPGWRVLKPGVSNLKLLVPIAVGVTNSGGYAPYMALCSYDGVALWAAMVGLYVVIPVTYGILVRGEGRTPRKLIGVGLCVVAGVLLGLPAGGEAGGDDASQVVEGHHRYEAPGALKLFLFLLCIGTWGTCDSMVAYVGRDMHTFWVALLTSAGFTITALIGAMMQYVVVAREGLDSLLQSHASSAVVINATSTALSGGADQQQHADVGSGGIAGYALLFGAQAVGIIAWYSSVKLGQVSEGSAFLPITSLYTVLTSLGGVLLLGETLPTAAWVGVFTAAGGMLLIATS